MLDSSKERSIEVPGWVVVLSIVAFAALLVAVHEIIWNWLGLDQRVVILPVSNFRTWYLFTNYHTNKLELLPVETLPL